MRVRHPSRFAALLPALFLLLVVVPCASARAGAGEALVGLAVQQAKLVASDGGVVSYLGHSVAIDGDTAVVGAYGANVDSHVRQGAAYVFTRSGGTWTQQAKLLASDGAANDKFGTAVGVNGDMALIGAPNHAVGGKSGQGVVYLFVRTGSTWTQQAALTATDGARADLFGSAVAMGSDTAVFGAPNKTVEGGGGRVTQGAAYVFVRSGPLWMQQARLTPDAGGDRDWFGWAVALGYDTAVVGAPYGDGDKGSAYVFTRSGWAWSQQAHLTASDGTAGDHFGESVSVSGDTAVVGAPLKAASATAVGGAAYVFTRAGTLWAEQAELAAPDGTARDRFGASVATSGATILVGADHKSFEDRESQGAAYWFSSSGQGDWSLTDELTAADGGAYNLFGVAAALSGDTALLGAEYKDGYRGAAYAYLLGHTITATAEPGGSITPSGDVFVPLGGSVTFTVTPSQGYHVVDVLVDGSSVGARSSYEFTDVSADHRISALFDRGPVVTITAPESGVWAGGSPKTVSWTISPAPGAGCFRVWATSAAGGEARLVSQTVVPVVPSRGEYSLECAGTLPAGSWDLSVYYYDGEGGFSAQNAAKPQILATWVVTASAGAGGTITPAGKVTVDSPAARTFSITPTVGYHTREVSVDGIPLGPLDGYVFKDVAADHTINASFEPNPVVTVSAPASGVWAGGSGKTVAWSVSPAPSVGTFRITATPRGGGTTRMVSTTVVPAVAGQKDYALDCVWALPAGEWDLAVYYFDGTGVFRAKNAVKPVVTGTWRITASAGAGGAITPSGVVTVRTPDTQTFLMLAADGYRVRDVVVDGRSVGAVKTYQFPAVTKDHTIAVSFTRIQ